MVITPTLRGLFGISIDAQTKTITVNPHLPASWDHAEIRNLHIGDQTVALIFARTTGDLTVFAKSASDSQVSLRSTMPGARSLPKGGIGIPMHPVAVGAFFQEPLPGDRTDSMRVVKQEYGQRQLVLTIEGLAGTEAEVPLVVIAPNLKLAINGAVLPTRSAPKAPLLAEMHPVMTVRFPPGTGWKTITVTLTW